MKNVGKIELRLYVSDSLISARTVYQWLALLETYPKDGYILRVRDVTSHAGEASSVTQLELDAYGVSFTPCMVARGAGRTVRIIGDLTTEAARATAVSRLRAVGLLQPALAQPA